MIFIFHNKIIDKNTVTEKQSETQGIYMDQISIKGMYYSFKNLDPPYYGYQSRTAWSKRSKYQNPVISSDSILVTEK